MNKEKGFDKTLEFEDSLGMKTLCVVTSAVAKELRIPCQVVYYALLSSKTNNPSINFNGTFKRGDVEVTFEAIPKPKTLDEFKELVLYQSKGNPAFLERITDSIGKYVSKYYRTGRI